MKLTASRRTQPFNMADASKLGILFDFESMLKESSPKEGYLHISKAVHIEYNPDYELFLIAMT